MQKPHTRQTWSRRASISCQFTLLFMMSVVPPWTAQRMDQVYIYIHPLRPVISLAERGAKVIISCRKIPQSSTTGPHVRLTISRSWIFQPNDNMTVTAGLLGEDLAVADASNVPSIVSSRLANRSSVEMLDGDTRLVFIMFAANCEDARYIYTCRSEMRLTENSASATFVMTIVPPSISVSQFATGTSLALVFSSTDALSLADSVTNRILHVEYNDVGMWQDVMRNNYRAADLVQSGCFVTGAGPLMTVRVNLFQLPRCKRRYRLYVEGAEESASEILINKGANCEDDPIVIPNAPMAILISVFLTVVLVSTAGALCDSLGDIRKSKKQTFQEQLAHKILTPMSAEQKERLMQEKVAKMLHSQEHELPEKPAPPSMRPMEIVLRQIIEPEDRISEGEDRKEKTKEKPPPSLGLSSSVVESSTDVSSSIGSYSDVDEAEDLSNTVVNVITPVSGESDDSDDKLRKQGSNVDLPVSAFNEQKTSDSNLNLQLGSSPNKKQSGSNIQVTITTSSGAKEEDTRSE